MAKWKKNVGVEADSWESTETVLSAFELVVVVDVVLQLSDLSILPQILLSAG